jgi:hypothetical protein
MQRFHSVKLYSLLLKCYNGFFCVVYRVSSLVDMVEGSSTSPTGTWLRVFPFSQIPDASLSQPLNHGADPVSPQMVDE